MAKNIKDFDSLPSSAYVPAQTVAAIIGMSQASIWRMAKAGKLTPKKVGLRATRFNVGEIRQLLAA